MNKAGLTPDGLALSEGYERTMKDVVLPALAARRTDLTVKGDGGRPLFCRRYDADRPAGTVAIVHGFTENADKFAELIHSLLTRDYSVLAYDQRGHGRSWRDPALTDLSLTHVDRFEEYVRDLECVAEQVLRAMPRPWLLFAHSMGGAVSGLFLEAHDGVFARAALCAPMIAPNLGGLPRSAGRLMCGAARLLGRRKKRVFISRPYAGPEDFETSCATGRERFQWYDALKAATPAFHNNGPTYGWTAEALRASRMLLAPGAPERITVPVALYTAETDNQVLPEAQRAFIERLPHGHREVVGGAKHEIYRSTDEVLFPWWHGVMDFLGEK